MIANGSNAGIIYLYIKSDLEFFSKFARINIRLKMRKIIVILFIGILLVSCGKEKTGNTADNNHFTNEILLKTTPVKNQGRSPLCWDYAMLATIETEHLMQGDSVNLSADFVARKLIEEEGDRLFLTHKGKVSLRGVMPMLVRLIQTYGLTHYDAFHTDSTTDYNVICRKVLPMAQGSRTLDEFRQRLAVFLDGDIHATTPRVYMLGAVYTPLEFAHSVCRPDEYMAFTSYTHHPFNMAFPLEIPDNKYSDTFMNVPIDSLMNIIVSNIRSGHPVCWEGDISEPGFSFGNGTAVLPEPLKGNVQEERQHEFENHQTTDDHCMEIVGIAHDSKGQKFFIMKNSWGTGNPYHGFMYVSFDYVRLKTIAIEAPTHL